MSPTATHTSITSTPSAPPISGTVISVTDVLACCAGADDSASAGAEAPPAVASTNTAVPSLALSPSFRLMLSTVPDAGDGISILALSDSKTTMLSPSAIVSPTATQISITSTPSAPPISGTATASSEAAAAGSALGASAAGAGASAVSVSSSNIGVPSETLSPTFTNMAFITPPFGAGISILALSDSNTRRSDSASIVSPTATQISITSTPSAPPMSGILIVSIATIDSYTVRGSAFSASMPYFAMASTTTFASILPWSANALSAVTAT